jgi:hypothetical protein
VKPYPSIHDRRGIYEHLLAHTAPDTAGLTESGEVLPDEEKVKAGSRIGWAPGALDGAGGFEYEAGTRVQAAEAIAHLLPITLARPNGRALRKFYAALQGQAALDIVDPLIKSLQGRGIARERLRDLASWLATTAPDREPVKIGIALLGVSGLGDRVDVVRVLGRHEEFTLYAAVAFKNGLQNPEPELFALAQQVDGWGRIQIVRRLTDTQDATIRDWILRTGFRNSIMNEYLAYVAATTGDLAHALLVPEPDSELLRAAGDILTALFMGGPAQDIDDYAAGAAATQRLLDHLVHRAETLDNATAVMEIEYFLGREGDAWTDREANGWTTELRRRLEQQCADILDRPLWVQLVDTGLHSSDSQEFWMADHLARRVGIDALPVHRARLESNPLDQASWFRAIALADEQQTSDLIELAERLLPIDEIATGPADATGFGPGFEAHGCLGALLQALSERSGQGPTLVLAALKSPVTRNRYLALRVLEEWGQDAWPANALELVTRCAASDPNEKTRATAGALIAST